ncbi:dynein regulatory complex subunit 2 [Halichoeres trimaculatus]|uniref:dynein regulatory complex subunit 2 n=1 Tax=Halichoeres trimaculatus TaxID=147232 RepID=UPI003D9DFE14
MPKKGKKAEGGGGKNGEGGSLNEQQKAGTWETDRKEAHLKEVRQRAQVEEDRTRQKERILKDKLQREERNSATNLMKINQCWLRILEQAQSVEQKEEIAVMKATFEREVEELDSIAEDLERKRQEQERRLSQVQHDHQQHMERLCDLHEKRLTRVHEQWKSCMLHYNRKQKMGHSKEQLRAELDNALLAIREGEKKETDEVPEVCQMAQESPDETDILSEFETSDSEELEEVRKKPKKASNAKRLVKPKAALLTFPNRPKEDMKKKQKLKETVSLMEDKLISKRLEQEQQEQVLSGANDQLYRESLKLRDQLSKNRAAARKKLTDLTVHSSAASKRLKALIAKGERIVQKGNICQKLESKVLALLPPEFAALGEDTEAVSNEFPELQNLMRRINTAALQGGTLRKRRQDLVRENQELKRQLRLLRDGNSPQHALSIRPTLLDVGPAPTSQARVNTQICHTVSQGVHLKRPGK